MVTLPQLNEYSKMETESFEKLSSIFSHYRKIIESPTTDFADKIRQERHHAWLRAAFATLKGDEGAEAVCQFWSQQSEDIIKKVWDFCGLCDEPLSLLAFGKLGSRELNLSSDIDIVFVKDSSKESLELSKKIKDFVKILSEVRPTGFAYRVDMNLRPGGDASPLVPNDESFVNFYTVYGEAWHRLSFIRLRPLWGPEKMNESIVAFCNTMSFPKRLDYSVIDEIKSLRTRLYKLHNTGQGPLDIKFHAGGIRDIELYIQSLQVIYGGHKRHLQQSSITQAIEFLFKENVLKKQDYEFFIQFYWKLRDIENHIQCYQDHHSYALTDEIGKCFAQPLNQKLLLEEFAESDRIVSDFFVTTSKPPKGASQRDFSESGQKVIDEIRNLKGYSLKKADVEKQKDDLLEKFVSYLDAIDIDSDLALSGFRDFIFSIKSKSSIFYLLNRHDSLLEHIAWLFSFSPYIGNVLSRRPELLDSFVIGAVDIDSSQDTEVLLQSLADYKLLGQFISIGHFLKNQNIEAFCTNLTDNADFICKKLIEHYSKTFSATPLEVLCLGKWSGRELGVHSDLDFVFLSPKAPNANDIKAARRFINALTTPSKAGILYNIDMRLNPNESAGPLLLEEAQLVEFLKEKAEPWQKQAYLRSRRLSDGSFFFPSVFDFLRLYDRDLASLKEIGQKLLRASSDDSLDIKYGPGGIVQSEFAMQIEVLRTGKRPKTCETSSLHSALGWPAEVLQNYFFLRRFEQLFHICLGSSSTKVAANHSALGRLAKALREPEPFAHLRSVLKSQSELLKSLDATN
ncbi:MAG: hypothetical protein KDD33_11250 [Bdellovibrionales bacterium]|nr:hypothetical protein [Bdellovibrionales bacterium]